MKNNNEDNKNMRRKNSPPTPGSTGPASNQDTSCSDFVILPRQSLEHGNHLQSLQLQGGGNSNSNSASSSNMVSVMNYDQLVAAARSMKEENNMLKEQLTDMMRTMEARTEEFVQMKSCNKQVAEKYKKFRTMASQEVSRLRDRIKTLENQLKENSSQESEKHRLQALETKIQELQTELKEKTEEVVVSYPLTGSAEVSSPVSLLTRLKEEISEVQGTRAGIQACFADLEEALKRSAAELQLVRQRAEHLRLEKQDLVALNNELQTQLPLGSLGGHILIPAWPDEEGQEKEGQTEGAGKLRSGQEDPEQAAAKRVEPHHHQAIRARHSSGKSAVALQDLLLQLQVEREKVAGLMEELKKERRERDEREQALMEQLSASSGEHSNALQELTAKHKEQVEELMDKLNELTVANQEPHHSMELKLQVRSLVCELQESESIMQQREHSVMNLRAVNQALKSKLALYHEELEDVRRQDSQMINMLREELQRQQNNLQLEKKKAHLESVKHAKMKEEYNQLFTDYDDLNRKYEECRTRSGQAVNAASLRELSDQRDNLTAQLISAEEAMGAKETQLEKVLTELRDTKAKLETIPVLQAQAEIYKNDFDVERAAREKAHMEREALMEELQLVRDENQRLQEDLRGHAQAQLQQMQQRHSTSGGTTGGGGNATTTPTTPSASTGLYERYLTPIIRQSWSEQYSPGTDEVFTHIGSDVDQLAGRDEAGTGVISPSKMQGGHDMTPVANPQCPKCQEEFPDIDTLQIHMLDCIQ